MFNRDAYQYLIVAGCDSATLRDLGWFFFACHPEKIADPRVYAAEAIHALLVDSNGRQISHDDRVVYGLLAFVESRCKGSPSPTKVANELAKVLAAAPVTRQSLIDWFLATYA